MLSGQECFEFCDLTEDEIHAIAAHEHVPEIIAAELGACLLQTDMGTWLIKRYMLEDIKDAETHGYSERAKRLHIILDQFSAAHPTYNFSKAR